MKAVISLLLLVLVGQLCHAQLPLSVEWYENATAIKDSVNFPVIDYRDDIFNPDNYEYVAEVIFNEYDSPNDIKPIVLQYLFIERYLDSCELISQEWYDWMTEYLEDE